MVWMQFSLLAAAPAMSPNDAAAPPHSVGPPCFENVYDSCAKLVWKALLRLGVAEHAVEDIVQEVFLIVHRRLPTFRGNSLITTWVYGIAVRVARNHRRARRHRETVLAELSLEAAQVADSTERTPHVLVEKQEASKIVNRLLDGLDDDLREVFVLAELEELTAVEIAEVLDMNPNTVASRLRAARMAFEKAARCARARDEWRIR
jgi:RNA polymerase sigma-70 factor (ECF subfamily)